MFRFSDAAMLDAQSTSDCCVTDDFEGMIKAGKTADQVLYDACKQNSLFMVKQALQSGAARREGLLPTCYEGHISIARALGVHVGDWFYDGLQYACEGGHASLGDVFHPVHGATTDMKNQRTGNALGELGM